MSNLHYQDLRRNRYYNFSTKLHPSTWSQAAIQVVGHVTDSKARRITGVLRRQSWLPVVCGLLTATVLMTACGGRSSASRGNVTVDAQATLAVTVTATVPLMATDTLTAGDTGATDAVTELAADEPPPRYTYEIVAAYPHDANAFTQGLFFDGPTLYEGTGLYGESTLRRVDLETGTVEQQIILPETYFGEGIALVADQIFQLTWREQTGFIYDKETFTEIGNFSYPTEGWGITYDGANLIMSDGSSQLYTLDPESLMITDQVNVTYFDPAVGTRQPVVRLNELEYIEGEIFANVWQTNFIVRINPKSGNVTGIMDLSGLLPAAERTSTTDVLNGIAYRPETGQIYVTGKKWPKLYEVRFIKQ